LYGQNGAQAKGAAGIMCERGLHSSTSLEQPPAQAREDQEAVVCMDSVADDGSSCFMPAVSEMEIMRCTGDGFLAAHVDEMTADVSTSGITESGMKITAYPSMIQAYERKLKEQNQRFWETARRMDQALSDEEAKCSVLADALHEAESNIQKYSVSETRLSEAENNASHMHSEIEQLRKAGRERVVRHTADMEALSQKLCNAQRRCLESEAETTEHQAEVVAIRSQLSEEAQEYTAMAAKSQTVLVIEAKLNHEVAVNVKLREQEKQLQACEAEVADQRRLICISAEEMREFQHENEMSLCILRNELSDVHSEKDLEESACLFQKRQVSLLREELAGMDDLRRDAAEVYTARAAEQTAVDEIEHLREEVQAEADKADRQRKASTELRLEMKRLKEEMLQDAEVRKGATEELRRTEFECRAYSDAALRAVSEIDEAKRRARLSDEQEQQLAQHVSRLYGELQTSQIEAEEQRSFWVNSHSASAKTEEQALASEARWAQQQIANEQVVANKAISAAQQAASEARVQRDSEASEAAKLACALSEKNHALMACTQEVENAEAGLAALESALASEWSAAQAMKSRLEKDLDASKSAIEVSQQEEAKEAIAARTEAETCASIQHQANLAREKVSKLQHAAEASWQENEELESELAHARAVAKRNGINATEARAELVTTKRELAKQRHAERDLQQAVDEVDTLSSKLRSAQRGREVAEHEVKQGQTRQAALERQVRDMQTRLTAERLHGGARLDRQGSADTWVMNDQQALFTDGIRPSSGRISSSPLAATVPGQLVRRNTPPAMNSSLSNVSDVITNTRAPSPSSASQGLGRSRSLGVLNAPGGPHADALDPQGLMPHDAACDTLGTLRTSPFGASSHPPRPPQASAPRMGWATHARSRGDGTPERHAEMQYNPEASSSIDRVIR
jgi:hypothetical protein